MEPIKEPGKLFLRGGQSRKHLKSCLAKNLYVLLRIYSLKRSFVGGVPFCRSEDISSQRLSRSSKKPHGGRYGHACPYRM